MRKYRRANRFRRRRVIYRRNRFKRVRRARSRVWKTPTLYVKLTKTIVVTASPLTDLNINLSVALNDFAEHINLGPNFERVKVYRQVVRVLPQQNVSNTSTSRVANYALIPYHKPPPTSPVTFVNAISIDKAKIYRQTHVGRMSFVPAARLDADATGGNQTIRTDWRPEFEISTTATLPNLYTGFVVFEATGVATGSQSFFTVVQDLYVRYKNQRSFI